MKIKKLLLVFTAGMLLAGCNPIAEDSSEALSADESSVHTETQYQIYLKAVAEGAFTGTYEEWLETIKGAKGDTGETGPKGDKGDKGSDGSSVLTGSGSPTSDIGSVGDSYIDLATWDFYVKDENGWAKKGNIKGEAGSNGAQGEKGDKGDTGETGAQGEKGEKGDKGDQGEAGENGADGQDSPHFGETHVVTFDANGGYVAANAQTKEVEVDYGDVLDLPIPVKPGYVFKGWFTGDTVNDGQWFSHTAVFDDVTLTARWDLVEYELPAGVEVIEGEKETYNYGDVVKIQPVLGEGLNFRKYTFTVNSFNKTTLRFSETPSYSYNYILDYTFGKYTDLEVVTYETPTNADGTEGVYTGSFTRSDGEEISVEIELDGLGYYTFNGDKSAMETMTLANNEYWGSGVTDELYFVGYDNTATAIYNASIHIDEEMADGKTYSYIVGTEDYDDKEVYFWLDGNAYEEPEAVDYAGTYSNDEITITINENGSGSIVSSSGTVTIISSERESQAKISLQGDNAETYPLTLQDDGRYKIRYEDETHFLTFKAYVFQYYGVFKGSYTDDEGTPYNVAVNVAKDKTVVVKDGETETAYKITEYSDTEITMLDAQWNKDKLVLKYQSTGKNQGKWQLSLESGTAYLTFTSYATNPLEGTWEGTCNDSEDQHKLVFNDDFSVSYYINGALNAGCGTITIDIANYPTSFDISYYDEGDEEEKTKTVNLISETSFKLSLGDGCGSINYTKQSA